MDLLVEIGERVAELCSKFVRGHGIQFLENRINRFLVLRCVAMRGFLMKNGMYLGWTIIKSVFEGSTSVAAH